MSGFVTTTFTPIVPKRTKLVDGARTVSQLERRMNELVEMLHVSASSYEAPPTGRYHRTYRLRHSWGEKGTVKYDGDDLVGEVRSSGGVADYNWRVKGKRAVQRKDFRARGWKSIEDIMEEEWPKAERDFKSIVASAGK